MTSKRSGLSEPSRYTSNALRMGTVIRVAVPGERRDAAMMISALVTKEGSDDNNLYALLTPHSRISAPTQAVDYELVRGPGLSRLALGTMIPASEVLGEGSENLGFLVLRIAKTPLFPNIRSTAKPVATVKNFRDGIWGAGAFKVRRLNDSAGLEPVGSTRGNSRIRMLNRRGRVAAEIEDVAIPENEAQLKYSYCGLVTRGRKRPLGEPRALGAPVISQSGALSAIIVGAIGNETLVYPFEELRRGRLIDFVTLGDDWPKVKMGFGQTAA